MDQDVLKKELQDGAYRLSSYYIAQNIVLIPEICFWMTFYSIIVFPITGVSPSVEAGFVLYLLSKTCLFVKLTT